MTPPLPRRCDAARWAPDTHTCHAKCPCHDGREPLPDFYESGAGSDTHAHCAQAREAARRLIGAYMAGEDLGPHINALETAHDLGQQGGN